MIVSLNKQTLFIYQCSADHFRNKEVIAIIAETLEDANRQLFEQVFDVNEWDIIGMYIA